MGAQFCDIYIKAKTEKEVIEKFEEYQEDCCYEGGHNAYAGHLGIKPGLKFIDVKRNEGESINQYIDRAFDDNDKWGPAWAVKHPEDEDTYIIGGWCSC